MLRLTRPSSSDLPASSAAVARARLQRVLNADRLQPEAPGNTPCAEETAASVLLARLLHEAPAGERKKL